MTGDFKTTRRRGEHRLTEQPRAERRRLDTSPFCSGNDKACSSRRVATLSFPAASTTGVSVDSNLNTMQTDQNRQIHAEQTPTTSPCGVLPQYCSQKLSLGESLCTMHKILCIAQVQIAIEAFSGDIDDRR